jgi:hypothetical protein
MTKRVTKLIVGVSLAIIALLAALILLAGPVIAADQCVIPGGGDGCLATIQAAINAAGSGDTVRVVAGTYPERVVITKNLTLLGGCTTSACTTRNLGTSIINGGGSGVVISIIQGAAVTIDGFTITGGNGTSSNGEGGGISIRAATAIIRNNSIMNNIASTARGIEGHGGGICVSSSTGPVGIYNNLIQANVAHSLTLASAVAISNSMGGGILIGDASSAIITGNQVLSNVALQANRRPLDAWAAGGGIVWWGNEMTLSNNTIQGNVANAIGGNGDGGGLGLWGQVATVTNNTIAQNTANVAGAYGSGGGIWGYALQKLTLNGNWVMSNTTVVAAASTAVPQNTWVGGGGINIDGSIIPADSVTIQGNHVIGNEAARTMTTAGANSYGQVVGGGLSIGQLSTSIILNNEVRGNTAVENLSLSGNGGEGGSMGGGLYLNDNDTVTINNNQILGNVAARQQTVNGVRAYESAGGGLALFNTVEAAISANTISGNIAVITGSTTGNATGNHSFGGGGMYIGDYNNTPNDSVTIANNHIIGNMAIRKMTTGVGYTGYAQGGGLSVGNMTTTLILNNEVRGNTAAENFSFSGNSGGPSGGGISLGDNDTVTISNNQILDNVAARQQTVNGVDFGSSGGGLALINTANATVNANTVVGNVTVVTGSITSNTNVDYDARGGGIMVACWSRPGCALSLVSNQILNNTTVQGVTLIGSITGAPHSGGLSLEANTALIQGNVISGNIANLAGDGRGGGIEARVSTITMQMNRLLGNRASPGGAGGPAVWLWESMLTSANDIFARNSSGGIGVATAGPAARVTVINDTFYNNGGVGIETYGPASTVYVTNTIISGHDDGLRLNDPASTLSGNYNLLNNAINLSGGATSGPNDILNLDPLFVNAPNNDFHLTNGSPAIDKGTAIGAPGVDFEGGSRPFGLGVDIGADEYGVGGGLSIYLPLIRK